MINLYLDMENTLSSETDRAQGVVINPANVLVLNRLKNLKNLTVVLLRQPGHVRKPTIAIQALAWAGNGLKVRTTTTYMTWWAYTTRSSMRASCVAEACEQEIKQYKTKRPWALITAEQASGLYCPTNVVVVDHKLGLSFKDIEQVHRAIS